MTKSANIGNRSRAKELRTRWLLSSPALLIIFCAAVGPLLVMVAYSFMAKGSFGSVNVGHWSADGWFNVFFRRDIFDGTVSFASDNLVVLGRSLLLALFATLATLLLGFPAAYYISIQPENRRAVGQLKDQPGSLSSNPPV